LLPLVGRDAVLADIGAVLARAQAGHGALALVTGEPGIGKTRLAEEAVARADGLRVVWVWCASDFVTGPFRPWAQVARQLTAAHAESARLVAGSRHLADLLTSDAGADHDDRSGDHGGDLEAGRLQLFDAFVELVRCAAANEPLLIVMDDLHDAQESTLRLLGHLAPALRTSAAVVLATARGGEHAWRDHVEVRAALVRHARSFPLAPLDHVEVATLVTHITGAPPATGIVSSIMARTGGQTLLVVELLRLLGVKGLAESAAIAAAVPESIRAIVANKMRGFDPSIRRLLSASAVLGTRFRLDVLADIAEVDLGDVRHLLRDAEAAGLVTLSEPGAGRFVHELLRDAVSETLPPEERERWHRRAGAVLSGLAERGRDVDPAEVAHHLLAAGPDTADVAASFAKQAGDHASALLAYEDAVQWYERAGQAFDPVETDPARRGALLLSLSEARLGCGDRAGARAGFLEAAALARSAGLPDVLARAALGLGSGPAGFEVGLMDRQQLELLEEATNALPEDHLVLRSLTAARLSVAGTMVESEERRRALAEGAVGLARQAEDDAALAYALASLCDVLAGPDHHRARLANATEIVDVSIRLRDVALELLGRRLRLVALLETGERPAVEAEMRAFRTSAEALRHPLYLWYIPLWRATLALAEGRFADCRAHNDEAEEQGRKAGSENAFLLTSTQRWCLLAEVEERAELEELFGSVDLEQLGGLWVLVAKALIVAQLGHTEDARKRLDAVAPQLGALPRDSEWLACLAQVAETIGLVGSHPVAGWVYESLRPHAEQFVVEGIGAAIRGPVHRHLGLLASALGEHELARGHLAAGVDAARSFGAPQLVERIQREQAAIASAPVQEPAPADGSDNVFHLDGELWTLRFAGHEVRLRDSKGLRDLAVLLARPGRQVAALDLMTAAGSPPGASSHDDSRLGISGDAGEALDSTARDAYRRRLTELEAEADDADARGDVGRASLIAAERDALLEQLTAAYGLGGRARKTGSPPERARTAVTARIRDTLRRVEGAHPQLGRHLRVSVRTGTFCSYEPEHQVNWQL
jgi:hypothetical protein